MKLITDQDKGKMLEDAPSRGHDLKLKCPPRHHI